MFFSRTALQKDDSQSVKVFHVGGHFFLNKIKRQHWNKLKGEELAGTLSDENEGDNVRNRVDSNGNSEDEID